MLPQKILDADTQELYDKVIPKGLQEQFDLARKYERQKAILRQREWRKNNPEKSKEYNETYKLKQLGGIK